MSYMPDSQQLDDRLEDLIGDIDDLCGALRARMDDPERWGAGHLQEIAELSIELQKMRFRLRKFKSGK